MPEKPKTTRVTCHHCGHAWDSKSTMLLVNCTSCGKKTPRVKTKQNNSKTKTSKGE